MPISKQRKADDLDQHANLGETPIPAEKNQSQSQEKSPAKKIEVHTFCKIRIDYQKIDDDENSTFRPKLNPESVRIAEEYRKSYQEKGSIHTRLYLMGKDSERKRKELSEQFFRLVHPFCPNAET